MQQWQTTDWRFECTTECNTRNHTTFRQRNRSDEKKKLLLARKIKIELGQRLVGDPERVGEAERGDAERTAAAAGAKTRGEARPSFVELGSFLLIEKEAAPEIDDIEDADEIDNDDDCEGSVPAPRSRSAGNRLYENWLLSIAANSNISIHSCLSFELGASR